MRSMVERAGKRSMKRKGIERGCARYETNDGLCPLRLAALATSPALRGGAGASSQLSWRAKRRNLQAMADLALSAVESEVMPEANPSARNLVPLSVLAALGRRSDLRGALQLAAHVACIAATGCLVWLARAHWYLLIPAMALHGTTIVTLFAPMHECVHRTAFSSRRANDLVG